MTKKDYIAFAKIFVDALDKVDREPTMTVLMEMMKDMIDLFRRDNKRFDAERFRDYITDKLKRKRVQGFNPHETGMTLIDKYNVRPLSEIASEIMKDWKEPYFGVVPYLEAMSSLDSIDDMYMIDSAKEIVLYFLSNATTWRGETAKRIKKELNQMLKNR
jgi:hypothetical protein